VWFLIDTVLHMDNYSLHTISMQRAKTRGGEIRMQIVIDKRTRRAYLRVCATQFSIDQHEPT